MKQFVAISDDMFYQHPELFERLVPFTHSIDCRHLLQEPLDQGASHQCDEEPCNQDHITSFGEESLCQPH